MTRGGLLYEHTDDDPGIFHPVRNSSSPGAVATGQVWRRHVSGGFGRDGAPFSEWEDRNLFLWTGGFDGSGNHRSSLESDR